jgi:hypothetical protein
VVASNESELTKQARRVWKKYMNLDDTIKVLFVYGSLHYPLEDFDAESDLVFPHITEGYPFTIGKTIEAFKVIQAKYSYDFLIRTNISTFWDFTNLHKHIDSLPTKNCYSGDGPLGPRSDGGWGYSQTGFYLSGVDTIVTPEMIESITSNTSLVNYGIGEDAAMGMYFNGILKAPMLPNRICFFEDITTKTHDSVITDRITTSVSNLKDHYRVKNSEKRTECDMRVYTILLKMIYGISET